LLHICLLHLLILPHGCKICLFSFMTSVQCFVITCCRDESIQFLICFCYCLSSSYFSLYLHSSDLNTIIFIFHFSFYAQSSSHLFYSEWEQAREPNLSRCKKKKKKKKMMMMMKKKERSTFLPCRIFRSRNFNHDADPGHKSMKPQEKINCNMIKMRICIYIRRYAV
jgi:hypothetical protein